MLIRLRVANFLSFKDEVELSMIAGKTRQHPSHVLAGGESRHVVDLLRGAVIFGANASGKSNLVKAIAFARALILQGTKARQPIPVRPFKLDPHSRQQPARFEFEIRTGGANYLYGFQVSAAQVVAEWCYHLKLTTEEMLFERETAADGQVSIVFGRASAETKKERDFLDFVRMGTRPNQLFLTECQEKNVARFQAVLDWFQKSLVILTPEARFAFDPLRKEEFARISRYLEQFDTGVCGIELQPEDDPGQIRPESLAGIEDELLRIKEGAQDQYGIAASPEPGGERLFFELDSEGQPVAKKLIFRHKKEGGLEEVGFEMQEESDGTLRLLDFIPILYRGEEEDKVFVVDELDRSLHPHLCYQLLETFLGMQNQPSQLIVTTHESNLLTLDLLRRDEIWFTEKSAQGATSLYSLEEFSPRYDRDIQKGYLLGRFGAVPILREKQF